MSGIAGVVAFKSLDLKRLKSQIIGLLRHRGKDGIVDFSESGHLFFQFFLNQRRKAEVESKSVSSNKIIVLADCRLDNRVELSQLLAIDENLYDDIEIIRRAYLKWGPELASQLLGDFAISIYDKDKQQVILIRDYMGVRPLYYTHDNDEFFAFASEVKALICLNEVPNSVYKKKLGAFLSWPSDLRPYSKDTFYEDVFSVSPATTLVFDIGLKQLTERCYWKPDVAQFKHLYSEQDFAQAFQKAFKKAVNRRVFSDYEIASHLSGGLDSSSVSVLAQEKLKEEGRSLHTIHYVPLNESVDERAYAEVLLKGNDFIHKEIPPAQNYNYAASECHILIDKPDTLTVPLGLYRFEEAQYLSFNGCRTLLTGHDGDTVVDSGTAYVNAFFDEGNFKDYKLNLGKYLDTKEYSNQYPVWNKLSIAQKVRLFGLRKFKSEAKTFFRRRQFLALSKLAIKMTRFHLISWMAFIGDSLQSVWRTSNSSLIEPTFFEPYELESYLNTEETLKKRDLSYLTNSQLSHFRRVCSAGMTESNETYNVLGAHYGFDVAHPFLDKELIELCLAIPERYKFSEGKGRGTLRLAMKGLLPEKIRNRTSKAEFSSVMTDGLKRMRPSALDRIKAYGYNKILDMDGLSRAAKRLDSKDRNSTKKLQRAYLMSNWLAVQQQKN